MTVPLTERWICDDCGKAIDCPDQGCVEWLTEGSWDRPLAFGFRIVHHEEYSPHSPEGCYKYRTQKTVNRIGLNQFLGLEGLIRLTGFMDPGRIHLPVFRGPLIKNFREFSDFFRRVQLPHYEQARHLLPKAKLDGALEGQDEVSSYTPTQLQTILERYQGGVESADEGSCTGTGT